MKKLVLRQEANYQRAYMADRLIQIVVPAAKADQMHEVIRRAGATVSRYDSSGDVHQFTVQVSAERVEAVLDPIQATFGSAKGFQAFVLPIEASLSGPEDKQIVHSDAHAAPAAPTPSRISRDELYADLSEHARTTRVYLAMVVLSTIVAAVGLSQGNVSIVIGAMVMAPLLGPNMALSLATTLGDAKLASEALQTNIIGVLLAAVVALVCGFLLSIDPKSAEIASRTVVAPTDLVVALASGIAGALAFTSGVPGSLVGVMVAVALLPPLVVSLMLLASGYAHESFGALLLLICNVVSINLAGVGTFLFQGVSPRTWYDAKRSKLMSRRSLAVWIALLVLVVVLIWVSNLSK